MRGDRRNLALALAVPFVVVVSTATGCAASVDDAPPTDRAASAILNPQRSAAAYSEAVQVTVNNSFNDFCTGVLVAPSVVLTAAHCIVFNPDDDGAGPHGTWIVRAPFASGGTQTRTASSAEAMDPAFYALNYFNYDSFDQNLHDLGLLYLDTPMTNVSYPTLSSTRYPIGASTPAVSAVGRQSVNTNAGLVLSSQVTLSATTVADGYPNDNKTARVTTGGDSGGPLFLEGTHTLVGTETRFDPGNNLDYWARLDGAVYTFIANRVATHGGFATTTLSSFVTEVSNALCTRVAACCAVATPGYVINATTCKDLYDRLGFEATGRGLSTASAANVVIDTAQKDACVTAINTATADCAFSSAEMTTAFSACVAAVTGQVGLGGACTSSGECAGNTVCQKNAGGAGTCTAIHAIGASCEVADKSSSVDERYDLAQDLCSKRGSGQPAAAYCDGYDFALDDYKAEATWTCKAAVGNGGTCGTNAGCTSRVCAPYGTAGQFTCVASAPFVTTAVCSLFAGP